MRTSNVILEQRLRLTFAALTETEMLSIRTHYIGQQGRFISFFNPNDLLSGMSSPASFTPTGYSWTYAAPPQITDVACGHYDVAVELTTVPPQGANINGPEFTVGASLVAGAATGTGSTTGFDLTVTASLEAGAADPGAVDPDFADVSLLLHMDGSNGSTTFTDSSSNGLTIGNPSSLVSIDTAQSKFGGASAKFDGSESLVAPDTSTSSVFAMGTGDFTMECWFRISSHTGAVRTLMEFFDGSDKASVCIGAGDTMTVRLSGTQITGTTSPAVDTWHHVALTRSSGDHRLFLNGTQEGSTWNNSYNQGNARIDIGQNSSGSQSFTGWMDDLRITKSIARYTSSFTPPTEAFPNS